MSNKLIAALDQLDALWKPHGYGELWGFFEPQVCQLSREITADYQSAGFPVLDKKYDDVLPAAQSIDLMIGEAENDEG